MWDPNLRHLSIPITWLGFLYRHALNSRGSVLWLRNMLYSLGRSWLSARHAGAMDIIGERRLRDPTQRIWYVFLRSKFTTCSILTLTSDRQLQGNGIHHLPLRYPGEFYYSVLLENKMVRIPCRW